MAVLTTDALPKYDPNDLPATVKKLHDYTTSLTEMLRFVLMNLDEDNVQGLDTHRATCPRFSRPRRASSPAWKTLRATCPLSCRPPTA